MALGSSNSNATNNGTSSKGAASSGGMASAMGAASSTASGGPSSSGNGGASGGASAAGANANAGSAAGASAAGTSGDSRQNGGTTNSGQSTTGGVQSGNVMGGLQNAVSAARDARNQNISGTQRGIASAVANAFGSQQAAAGVNAGTTSPNATPGQQAAYNAGYRNETNSGLTRSAFGALPGMSSLVGEGIARTAMSQPSGLADNEAAAYATGTTGAKDAGIGNTARTAGSLIGGVLGGPIGSALASMALGGYSYSQQRAANPQAFAGEATTQSQGPVNGSMTAALTGSNAGNNNASGTSGVVSDLGNYGMASDYNDAYRSYQNMNLGNL